MVKLCLLALVGCTTANPAFCPTGENPDGTCIVDCVGSGADKVCLQTAPSGPKTLTDLDTTTDCDEIVALGCVISGTDLTIDHHITLHGSRPAILFASGTLTITGAGVVDANGSDQPGAGGNVACTASTAPASVSSHGGGGAGGTFASVGGAGGTGGAQSRGGTAAAVAAVTFGGGCNGGDGADGSAMSHGAGGFAGGGIYLAAVHSIAIAGGVLAAGEGGAGGTPSRGGGGGGASGGMIIVATPMLTIAPSALLVANGGGGGGAASNNLAGVRGTTSTTIAEPRGGLGMAVGGSGAYGTAAATAGAMSGDGGAGGGGGAGVIRVLGGGSLAGAQVSPPPS